MTKLLNRVMLFDTATCLGFGALLIAGGTPLAEMLGLPRAVLLEAGIFLLPYAVFVVWAARNAERVWPVRTVAFANLAWTAASFALLTLTAPTALGIAFVAAQAIAVGALAAIQLYLIARQPAIA